MADQATLDLLMAMRRGRAGLMQGRQNFMTGGGLDLSTLFTQQGLGGQQTGLESAMAKYRGRMGEEEALNVRDFERGLSGIESENTMGQAIQAQDALQQMAQQAYRGRLMEGQLRQSLFRVRQNQQQQALLSGLGTILGLVL